MSTTKCQVDPPHEFVFVAPPVQQLQEEVTSPAQRDVAVMGELVVHNGPNAASIMEGYAVPIPQPDAGAPFTNVRAPANWTCRTHWRRRWLYQLIEMQYCHTDRAPLGENRTLDSTTIDGYYRCRMPREDGRECGDIIRDRQCEGKDLESHAAAFHNVERLPVEFTRPNKRWATGLCDCLDDVPGCLDCLFCPCCHISRLQDVTTLRFARNVEPYVRSYTAHPACCTPGTCGVALCGVFVQPWAYWLPCIWPWMACEFADEYPRLSMCHDAAKPVLAVRNLQHIDENICETKCKLFWCCPLAVCQTYRELRHMGVNPGLSCTERTPLSDSVIDGSRRYHASEQPSLENILAANHGGFPRQMVFGATLGLATSGTVRPILSPHHFLTAPGCAEPLA